MVTRDDKDKRVEGAIADLGKEAEPRDGRQGRVMDAVAWQERVRHVVRDAYRAEMSARVRAGHGKGPGPQADFIDAIAARVASQLASASPALSAEERDQLVACKSWAGMHCLDLAEAHIDRLLGSLTSTAHVMSTEERAAVDFACACLNGGDVGWSAYARKHGVDAGVTMDPRKLAASAIRRLLGASR